MAAKERSKENKLKRLYNQLSRYHTDKMRNKIENRIHTLEKSK